MEDDKTNFLGDFEKKLFEKRKLIRKWDKTKVTTRKADKMHNQQK